MFHATFEVVLGHQSAVIVIGATGSFQAPDVSRDDRLALAIVVERKASPLRRNRFVYLLSSSRSPKAHGSMTRSRARFEW